MTKSTVTKDELNDLKAMGFVEGNKNTIPENISPVLKSKLLKGMGENDAGSTPGEAGGPDARAARVERQQNALADDDTKAKRQDATK